MARLKKRSGKGWGMILDRLGQRIGKKARRRNVRGKTDQKAWMGTDESVRLNT